MPFEIAIALRYLLAPRKQALISLISLISTLGVAVGVMAVIVVLALMTGLQGELRDRLLGSQGHIYVLKQGGIVDYREEVNKLRAMPRVEGAAPALLGVALASSARSEAFITLKGVDPALEPDVTEIGSRMQSGRLTDLTGRGQDVPPGIVIGKSLSEKLGAFVGDTITLLTPQGTLSPMGMLPRSRPFRVVGIFSLGLFEVDSSWGFIALPVAQRLFNRVDVEYIQLRVDNLDDAPRIAATIPERLGSLYLPQDWTDINQSLFSALWMERVAMAIAVFLIVVVAALQIVSSLVLLVMEKSPDIGILKTMGVSTRSVMGIFMLQGTIIGLVGTTIGAIGGVGLATILDRYRLIRVPMDVYQIEHVPFVVEPFSLAIVVLATIGACFLATIYPSRQAARLDPVEALRYG
ncbi:MAG TPA: ABC transporter permease [Vicinamibacterales bacterium]|jgi:lipoprotein-releasing system permease protein